MIPITIVTGFLGSGKTSLIAHLLDSTGDQRIAVIVNDLANKSIDTAFLNGGEHIEMRDSELLRAIPGGRIGAGKRDELIAAIESIAAQENAVDAIVVETSGSSPALDLHRAIHRHPSLDGKVYVDTITAIIDTSTFPDFWRDPQLQPLLEDQIVSADLIVLNKFDRAGYWRRRKTRKLVTRINPSATVGSAEYGRLPVNEVIATGRRSDSDGGASSVPTTGTPTNPNFRPVVARFLKEERPFHPERLDAWLNTEWPGIVRIKGFAWLATDMDRVYVVDVAGPQRELGIEGTWYAALAPEERPDDEEIAAAVSNGAYGDRRQAITLIGVPDAVERELRNLRSCLLSRPELDRGPRGWQQMNDPIAERFAGQEAEENTDENGNTGIGDTAENNKSAVIGAHIIPRR